MKTLQIPTVLLSLSKHRSIIKALRQAQCDSVQFISEVLRIKYKEICNSKSYCPAEPVEASSKHFDRLSVTVCLKL